MRLMSKQRIVKVYMHVVVAIGVAICIFCATRLPIGRLGVPFLLLALMTIALASRVVINFPRFKSCVSVSDVFIFITLLLFDAEAAILLGAVEALISSLRISKKPLTIAFNAAAMAWSTFLTVIALRLSFGPVGELIRGEYSSRLIVALCLMAFVQYVTNSGLIAIAGALRANKPIWATWKEHYIWTSITYFAGASTAGITVKLIGVVGFYAFMATMPIVAIVYLTYRTYLKNIEASDAQATQAEKHLAELQESEERFRSSFDYAPIGMALVTPSGRMLQVNHSLCEIVGYSEEELVGMNFRDITHPDDLKDFLGYVCQVLDGKLLTRQMEKRYLHKNGQGVWVSASISIVRDSQGKPLHLVFQIQDVTVRKGAEERLLHDAFHDGLTGLPNRAFFIERLTVAVGNLNESANNSLAVLFLDLDRFKVINDSIGHMIGDQLLVGIARKLQESVRPGDTVARLGGDEFTILLDGIRNRGEALEVAERIQKQVSQPFNLSGYETFTTVSIGIAFSNSNQDRPDDLLRDADTAMYQAKSLGKARYAIFDKTMHARAMSLLQLETDMRRAIDREEFVIHYQPIVSLETGRLSGFEALVRWRHPERGPILPEDFIAVAEETGFILPIGEWVLRQACEQMRRWQELVPLCADLSISINISNRQFAHPELLDNIMQILKATNLDPRSLKLEITESVMMENIEVARGVLKQLQAIGVEFSIDDFGTGYSSLSCLHQLPINTLKIDRSFVRRIGENSENKEIVRTIITLAQSLGMGVIAEGIETKEQLERLRELKCPNGQGYLFSKPIDAETAENLILNPSQWQASDLFLETAFQEDAFAPPVSTYTM
jgi:diguanylate cyclase (GGDEF)-like protein/PAS domain S-box-containing protein